MSWRFHGQAEVNPESPRAFAICDRCSRLFNLYRLGWQYQYAGPNLQNLRLLVCPDCMDVPQPQLKPRILPPDPMPVLNARPENYIIDDIDYQVTQDDVITVTQEDVPLVGQNVANNRAAADEEVPPDPPHPPEVFDFLTDGSGSVLVDDDGNYLTTP